jgi:CHAT domain-containing protein
LALAGADLPPGALPDGGILSAEAIAGLPLDGLRFVVLTEGGAMSGLAHAFHVAGCPDVVATLWNVDDEAAAAVVKLFFQGVWRRGLVPLQALRRAQLLVLQNPEKIGELATLEGEPFEAALLGLEQAASSNCGAAGRAPAKRWAAFSLSGAVR